MTEFETPEQVSWSQVTSQYPKRQAHTATVGLVTEFPKIETANKQAHSALTEDERKAVQRRLNSNHFNAMAKALDQAWNGPGWLPPEVRAGYSCGNVPQKVVMAMEAITKVVQPGSIELLHSLWGPSGILRRRFKDFNKFTGPLATEASNEVKSLLAKGGFEALRTTQLQDTTSNMETQLESTPSSTFVEPSPATASDSGSVTSVPLTSTSTSTSQSAVSMDSSLAAAPSLPFTEVASADGTSNPGVTSESYPPSTLAQGDFEDSNDSGMVAALPSSETDGNHPTDVTPTSLPPILTGFAQGDLEGDHDSTLVTLSPPPLGADGHLPSSEAPLPVLGESVDSLPVSVSLFESTCEAPQMHMPTALKGVVSSFLDAGTAYTTDLKRKRSASYDLIEIEDHGPRSSRPRVESLSLNSTKVRQQLSSKTQMTDDVLDLLCHAAMSEHSQMASSIVLAPPTWFLGNSSDDITTLPSRLREHREGQAICFPINFPGHWAFGVLEPIKRGFRFHYHDSLRTENRSSFVVVRVRAWLAEQGHADKLFWVAQVNCPRQSDGWSCGIRAVCCFNKYLQGELCPKEVIPEHEQHWFLHCLETLDKSALPNFPVSWVPTLWGLSKIESRTVAETDDSTITVSTVPAPLAAKKLPGTATSTVDGGLSIARSPVADPSSKGESKSTTAGFHQHLSSITLSELERHLSVAKQRQQDAQSAERGASESVLVLKTQLRMQTDLLRKRDDAEGNLKKRLDRSQPKANALGGDNSLDDYMRKEQTLDNIIASTNENLARQQYQQLLDGAKFMSTCLVGADSALESKVQTAQGKLLAAQKEVAAANQEVSKFHGEIEAKKRLQQLASLEAQAARLKGELEQWWTNYRQ
ncbi:hypothetical protein N0V84_012594 [Fusarium piperis]|uniref:Ubiquitin-like protease family profile domain-containing protein n=1 Tax=Fusarium piperis TaxID=1435070 RepID=A0A9W8W2L3_9HYPO|nr:hypothetical protein N0V84_012594 [Fusarium piperis]